MTEHTNSTTEAPSTVWASFHYADALGAITFLTEVLGFHATLVVTDDDDPTIVHHSELWWPEGGGVMLGTSNREGSEFSTTPVGGGTYVVTADLDGVYQRVTAAGATIVRPLEDTDYGSRQFVVADPEGVLWCFGTYRGLQSPE